MGLRDELKKIGKTTWEQLTTRSKSTSSDLSFTMKCRALAERLGLTLKDAADVYYHGEIDRANKYKMRKAYGSYEIGIIYFLSKYTGKPVISFIWINSVGENTGRIRQKIQT